jgi:AcrR family transcriptional regulator
MQTSRSLEAESGRRADKRRELALHTLTALAELGFARINLREVAARSGAQLGSIHYYFEDKTDLLVCAVRLYKDEFILGLEQLIGKAEDAGTLVEECSAALGQSIADQPHMHRLWYDVRAQALFDPAFRPLLEELETQLAEVTGRFLDKLRRFGARGVPDDALATYLQIDAWFRYCLQRRLSGDAHAGDELVRRLRQLLENP